MIDIKLENSEVEELIAILMQTSVVADVYFRDSSYFSTLAKSMSRKLLTQYLAQELSCDIEDVIGKVKLGTLK